MKKQVLWVILLKFQDVLQPRFSHQSDDNGVISQVRSFEKKVYFVT